MSQIRNEHTKLLATGLNNVAVACIVIGVVTPISAMGFGVASAPLLSFRAAPSRRFGLWPAAAYNDVLDTRYGGSSHEFGGDFVTFVLPATLVVMGWLAVHANGWAIMRDEAREKRAPGV